MREPRAFLALDTGAATVASALIGRVGGRWRLIGSLSMPAGADTEGVLSVLVDRAVAADPVLGAALELHVGSAAERSLVPLVATASRSGWRTVAASAESMDPLAMTTLLLDGGVAGVLVGASDPPAADERRALGELAALVAAAAGRRPELIVILAGGMADHLGAFEVVGARAGEVVLGPAAPRGSPGGPLAGLAPTGAGRGRAARFRWCGPGWSRT